MDKDCVQAKCNGFCGATWYIMGVSIGSLGKPCPVCSNGTLVARHEKDIPKVPELLKGDFSPSYPYRIRWERNNKKSPYSFATTEKVTFTGHGVCALNAYKVAKEITDPNTNYWWDWEIVDNKGNIIPKEQLA